MSRLFRVLLAICAVAGLTGRLWNSDFDQRQHLHPDERFWALTSDALARAPQPTPHGTIAGPVLDWLDGQRSPANPYRVTDSFVYGPVTLVLTRSVAGWLHEGVTTGAQPARAVAHAIDALGHPLIDATGGARFDDGYQIDLIGRLLSAVFDTFTIVLVGLIARRLGGELAGVFAAALYAACVLAIQYSHFLGSEPLLGLACAATVLSALRLDRGADSRRGITSGGLLGLFAGATLAVKFSAAGLVAVPFVGAGLLLARHRRRSDVLRLAAMLLGTALAFRFLNPGAFQGLGLRLSPALRADMARVAQFKNATSPPAFQWVGRKSVLQPLVWLGLFSVGPGVALASLWAAIVLALHRFGEPVSAWLGACRRVSARRAAGLARRGSELMSDVGDWTIAIVAGGTAVPFLYVVVTALPASRYFFPMLPCLHALAGLGIAAAIRLARRSSGAVKRLAFGFAALTTGAAVLWGVAFVNGVYARTNTRVEASQWIAANVPAGSTLSSESWDDGLPLRLPGIDADAYVGEQLDLVGPDDLAKVSRVTDQLLRIDYVVESSPRIWGTVTRMPARFPSTINFFDALDSGALGFERVATFTGGLSLGPWSLDESRAEEGFSVYDHPEVRIWEKRRDLDAEAIITVLDPSAAANAVAVDPTRGEANGLMLLEREVAMNAAGPTYDDSFATNGSTLFHTVGWFALMELLGLSAFALFLPVLGRLPDAGLGLSKTIALVCLALVVFICATWLRLTLDRGLVIALVTGFIGAGGYRAWRQRVALAELWADRRTLLVVAEVLGVACFASFVMLRGLDPDLWHPSRGGEKPFELALLTAVLRTRTLPVYDPWFSGGVLNYYYGGWFLLSVPARVLRTSPMLVLNLGLGVFAWCAAGSAYSVGALLSGGSHSRWRRRSRGARAGVTGGVLAAAFVLLLSNAAILDPLWDRVRGRSGPIDWWSLSRVIPNSVAITEFPAWSFLFGDLHPHLMGIALVVAVGGLCLAWHDALTSRRSSHSVVLAGLIGATVGLLRMTNTWDVPLAFALIGLTILIAWAKDVHWARLAVAGAVTLFVVFVVFSPYTRRGEVFDAGFDPATIRTPPSSWAKQFGFFAAVCGSVVLANVSLAIGTSRRVWRRVTRAHLAVVGLSAASLGYIAVRPGFEVFEVAVALSVGALWLAWHRHRSTGRRRGAAGMLVMAIGWGIQAGVELFTVRNDGGRMNTVFKFWYESWIVLAVGAAAVLADELHARRGLRRTGAVLLTVALLLSVAFWAMATPVRVEDRVSVGGWSLDGEAYLRAGLVVDGGPAQFAPGDDQPLIDWLRKNVRGVHTVAEAPGIDYRWTGRISSSTGLPTPIGWAYHESQQRRPYTAMIDTRTADLTSLYTTTDEQEMARVLARYSVAYLVFGTQERLLASRTSAAALRSFECLTVMRQADRSTQEGVVPGDLFVAIVDSSCVTRLRPLPPPPPPMP